LFYQSTEQPLWGEDQIHKEDPYKDATEPVKTHYYSPKVKAFLEKAGYNFRHDLSSILLPKTFKGFDD